MAETVPKSCFFMNISSKNLFFSQVVGGIANLVGLTGGEDAQKRDSPQQYATAAARQNSGDGLGLHPPQQRQHAKPTRPVPSVPTRNGNAGGYAVAEDDFYPASPVVENIIARYATKKHTTALLKNQFKILGPQLNQNQWKSVLNSSSAPKILILYQVGNRRTGGRDHDDYSHELGLSDSSSSSPSSGGMPTALHASDLEIDSDFDSGNSQGSFDGGMPL